MTDPRNTSSVGRRLWRLLLWSVLLLALAAAAGGWFVWTDYQRFADAPLDIGVEEGVIEVKRGDAFHHVLRRLRRAGITQGHDLYWRALAWDMDVMRRLQVGEYQLAHGLTPRTLLQRFERGLVIQHRFTLVEGWNFRELRAALAARDDLEQTLPGLSDETVMERVGAPGLHPEGRFLPETYHFTRGTSDLRLLQRAFEAMRKTLDAEWPGREPGLPLSSADEALILASIIEKETGQPHERPDIAGVFVRRLNLGMRLQTDPTVIYGMGERYDGNIRRSDLTTDTPWNTYTRAGLPPTPIAMPGRAAIRAALHPKPGDTLYFVARGDGSHVFSRTLAEHNRAVRRYQLGLR